MNEDIKTMVENFHMGFISPTEFLMQYSEYLRFLGAEKCIVDKMDELLSGLACSVAAMLESGNRNNNRIENYGNPAWSDNYEEGTY